MSFTRGQPTFGSARQYWQAGGDTSVAWDTKGNAYLSCQVFNRGAPPSSNPDLSSAFYVFRSTQNHGASWNFPGRPVAESSDLSGSGVPAFEDKQLLSVDNHPGSPFQDRVYVSWTEFSADGSAYIWESYSSDYGEHFSPRHLVSQTSPFCTNTFGAGTPNGNCNENQFSQPFTGRDGALYVAYASFNNQARSRGIRVATWAATRSRGRQPLPDAAGQVPRRRQHVLGAGQGRRLLRPSRLPDLPGRVGSRAVVRAGEGRDRQLVLPGRQLPVGRRQPDKPAARSS